MNKLIKTLVGAAALTQVVACTTTADMPLGQEKIVQGEKQTIKNISDILTGHLKEQYGEEEKFLRDTHPKANACLQGNFIVDANISSEYQYGVFKPGKPLPVWMRFSNAVEELTDDYEKDFRGLAVKVMGVEGDRVAAPGDEQHTQDFLFLGHDAFFAANPKEFFDFFDAAFSDKSIWFLLTHPKGAFNIFQGQARYKNPINVPWNSVTSYALGPKALKNDSEYGEITAYKNVVRYTLRTCQGTMGTGSEPSPDMPDYMEKNIQDQLHKGSACLDFFIQLQKDPHDNPVENALVAWDTKKSPFIKVARIEIPTQNFTSERQKNMCESMSFNPGHSLTAHEPLGGINRARKVVMKDISDLRLKENSVQRFEPKGGNADVANFGDPIKPQMHP